MANEQRSGEANFANDPKRASEASRKGGEQRHGQTEQQQSQSGGPRGQQGGRNENPGNFANDRQRASEAGRKGGES